MRALTIIFSLSLIASCYAYQIIHMQDMTSQTQEQITEESLKLHEKLDARLPVKSKATAGEVSRHSVDIAGFSNSLFILGDDDFSYQWLKDNAQELEEIHALGFITNIRSTTRLQKFQALTKAPLLPANVDDLLAIFNESHYPLIFHQGEIWQ